MLPFECLNYNTWFHIGALATFRPTECLTATASYLRVRLKRDGAARGLWSSSAWGMGGGPWSWSPRSRYLNLPQHGTGVL